MLKIVSKVKFLIVIFTVLFIITSSFDYLKANNDVSAKNVSTENSNKILINNQLENRAEIIKDSVNVIDDHKLIAQNDKFEMYLNEKTLSIIIRDKSSGSVMYSTVSQPDKTLNQQWRNFVQSGIVMEYLTGTNVVRYTADMFTGDPKKNIEIKSDGFSAKIEYPGLKISYKVNVTLTNDGFVVEIPKNDIAEKSNIYKVAGFYVYPFLGYTKLGNEQGYMFIPDGSGALIYLKDNKGQYKQPYSQMVYGNDIGIDDLHVPFLFNGMNPRNNPEKILAPVFGMVHTDSKIGYLGIIESGDSEAMIEAYPSGAITPYNWISTRFIYRQFYNQLTSKSSGAIVVRQKNLNNFNIKVRYEFVTGDEANYVGLAKKFRQYLLNNKIIIKKNNDFKIRLDFLGADKENGLLFKRLVPMTTTNDISKIIDSLRKDGVSKILSVYKGWQSGGIYGGLPSYGFNVENKLGGEKGLQILIDKMKNEGLELYLYQDELRLNPDENKSETFYSVKKLNEQVYEEHTYGKVYDIFNYLVPKRTLYIMEHNRNLYKENKINDIMIGGISNVLFSYFDNGNEYDRTKTENIYNGILSSYSKQFNVLLDESIMPYWKYTEAIANVPVESSHYIFEEEDIPFFAIALKGIVPMYSEYINFQPDQKEFFLKLVEQGVFPSFYITYEDSSKLINTNSSNIYSSKFDLYRETIDDYYKKLLAINDKIKNAVIDDYIRTNGVTEVKYSNGVNIYINYNDKAVTIDGFTISGNSYKVVDNR